MVHRFVRREKVGNLAGKKPDVGDLDLGVTFFLNPNIAAVTDRGNSRRCPYDLRGSMSKSPRVMFSIKRIAEGDWQIEAHFPGVEIRYIAGLTSKSEADDWLAGERRHAWLRSQGAKVAFRAAWERFYETLTPDDIEHWHHQQDARQKP
jgi:hypothetical protein